MTYRIDIGWSTTYVIDFKLWGKLTEVWILRDIDKKINKLNEKQTSEIGLNLKESSTGPTFTNYSTSSNYLNVKQWMI